jgi:phage terminase small subunit
MVQRVPIYFGELLIVTTRQVKATLNAPLATDLDSLSSHLGLCPSSLVKLAIRRLAQAELPQSKSTTSLELTKEVA